MRRGHARRRRTGRWRRRRPAPGGWASRAPPAPRRRTSAASVADAQPGATESSSGRAALSSGASGAEHGARVLRLHREHDDLRACDGRGVVGRGAHAEIARQRLARALGTLSPTVMLLGTRARAQQAADERAAHVAAAEECTDFGRVRCHARRYCTRVPGLTLRAEQRRADAHDGGALGDRRFEVVAHAHGEGIEAGAAAVQCLAAARAAARTSGAGAPGPSSGGGMHMSPRSSGAAAPPRRRRAPAAPQGQRRPCWPRRRCSPAGTHSAAGRERGAARDRRSAMRRRSTPCTQSKCSATGRVLLACSRPMKCQVSAQIPQCCDLGQRLLQVALAEVASSPASAAARSSSSGCALPTARSVTECDTRARRRATARADALAHFAATFRANSADPLTYWHVNPSVILPARSGAGSRTSLFPAPCTR